MVAMDKSVGMKEEKMKAWIGRDLKTIRVVDSVLANWNQVLFSG